MFNQNNSYISLKDYQEQILSTDKLPKEKIYPIIMGLYGEVGSLMTTVKKYHREGSTYTKYEDAAIEELGDTIWYFSTLLNRLGYNLDDIFCSSIEQNNYIKIIAASNIPQKPVALIASNELQSNINETLLKMGKCVAELNNIKENNNIEILYNFAGLYLDILKISGISFLKVLQMNLKKVHGRFTKYKIEDLPDFDIDFPTYEQLPREFAITIRKNDHSRAYMDWNGVFIGDPLTDNHKTEDGYKFHDVFHLANAAVLHWSPTFRALIKHKRKSNRLIDEAEDGGRAIVIEEGLTAWIFSRAKEMCFFEQQTSLSFDLLKTIQEFVKGYEVEECPLSLWESAILQGYEVFRELKKNGEGIIIGNRTSRTIEYKAILNLSSHQ